MIHRSTGAEHKTKILSETPDIGLGNPTENKAICNLLKKAGFEVIEEYPKGIWVRIGGKFHIEMTQSTKKTMDYLQNSANVRDSYKTKPLLRELKSAILAMLKLHPDAQFFLTPQNMTGEIVTTIKIKNRDLHVIMVLPDAMGKLSPDRKPTDAQRKINYLVWNRNAYEIMTANLGLKYVQLIDPIDPLFAYAAINAAGKPILLNQKELISRGFKEVLDYDNVCVIKLSGSGGDPKLINAAMTSLWEKNKTRCIVFPGQKKTGNKLLRKLDRRTPITQSYDEGDFYQVARQMHPNSQMLLSYPSEQFKHVMVLSKEQRQLNVVWLPPRGDHELRNLIELIDIAHVQNELTTICVPKEYHDLLHNKLQNEGYSPGIYYNLIDPSKLEREHFNSVPSWDKYEDKHKNGILRVSAQKAVQNIVAKHR